ncbi:MAG TPA: UvrD-helicase domain-containing protein, partial [Verrucomicrobiae bacterium]
MSLTAAQNEAIAARGNVLVVAGAGTGKTRTLVERCLACLVTEHPRTALDEILLVTFTEAAAAEMRQRIRSRIEQESARNPRDPHWQEQLALFETAHLGTIHSFCFELVRSHFYELELDPQLSILPEEEARLLAEETLDRVLQAHYGGKGGTAQTVQQLIQAQAKGSDQPIRTLVLRLHKHIRALPDAEEWLRSQSAVFANPVPELWRTWLGDAVADWRECSLPTLGQYREGNGVAKQCFGILADLPPRHSLAQAATALAGVLAAEKNCPHGKKKHWIKPLEDFFTNCRFLLSLLPADGQPDPLHQDWDWVRGQMSALLGLAGEFGAAFLEAKKELGVLDFQDLEQYALKLLWDTATGKPTSVAVLWRQNLRFVFVDEYQDVNAAQDKIIQALSREGAGANRFLVGDVKQSIYRFRLANPHIFQGYIENWRNGPGRVIPLQENFRSRKEILEFVNSLSSFLMHRELGGIDYDERARLLFGERDDGAKDVPPSGSTAVEIQLRVKGDPRDENDDLENPEAATELADLEEAGKEARSIALRVQALKTAGHLVRDEKEGRFRAVEWRDISILLRAPSNKAESYAKEFARLDVPLEVARGGFYDSLEIADLLSLLQVLDNPLQDLPLLALLRSPLVGLTLDDLAELRLAARRTSFWTALVRWSELNSPQSAARQSAVGGMLDLGRNDVGRVSAPGTVQATQVMDVERYSHVMHL